MVVRLPSFQGRNGVYEPPRNPPTATGTTPSAMVASWSVWPSVTTRCGGPPTVVVP